MLTYISPLERWGSAKRSRALLDALCRHGDVHVLVLNLVRHASATVAVSRTGLPGIPVTELTIGRRGLRSNSRFDLASDHVSAEVARHVDLSAYDLIVSRYIRPAMKLQLPQCVPLLVDFDDAVYVPPWHALHSPKQWVGVLLRLFNDRVIVRTRLRAARWRKAYFMYCRAAERDAFGWLPGSVLPNLPPAPDRAGPPDFTPPARPALMFVGLLDYMPNHDAVDWFIDAIWPRVLAAVPDARFLIVGTAEPQRLERWGRVGAVETLGFVESLADTYALATACVVPMRAGAGTNIKALEPYLYGRMVIATPLVVEGHEPLFTPGRDVLVAADAEGFARHCIAMLSAPDEAGEIARRGHARVTGTLTDANFRATVNAAVAAVMHGGLRDDHPRQGALRAARQPSRPAAGP